jgi:hypothetical protein
MKPMSCSTTTTERVLAISLSRIAVSGRLRIGHAGHRLVDQKQLRLLRQKHADLQPLLLAVREIGGQIVARASAHGRENLVDARLVLRGQAIEQRRKHAALAVQRQFDIVPDRMAFEHRRLLELAADAELGDIRLVLFGQVDLPLKNTSPLHPAGSCR